MKMRPELQAGLPALPGVSSEQQKMQLNSFVCRLIDLRDGRSGFSRPFKFQEGWITEPERGYAGNVRSAKSNEGL